MATWIKERGSWYGSAAHFMWRILQDGEDIPEDPSRVRFAEDKEELMTMLEVDTPSGRRKTVVEESSRLLDYEMPIYGASEYKIFDYDRPDKAFVRDIGRNAKFKRRVPRAGEEPVLVVCDWAGSPDNVYEVFPTYSYRRSALSSAVVRRLPEEATAHLNKSAARAEDAIATRENNEEAKKQERLAWLKKNRLDERVFSPYNLVFQCPHIEKWYPVVNNIFFSFSVNKLSVSHISGYLRTAPDKPQLYTYALTTWKEDADWLHRILKYSDTWKMLTRGYQRGEKSAFYAGTEVTKAENAIAYLLGYISFYSAVKSDVMGFIRIASHRKVNLKTIPEDHVAYIAQTCSGLVVDLKKVVAVGRRILKKLREIDAADKAHYAAVREAERKRNEEANREFEERLREEQLQRARDACVPEVPGGDTGDLRVENEGDLGDSGREVCEAEGPSVCCAVS